jgi:hypothetical protein
MTLAHMTWAMQERVDILWPKLPQIHTVGLKNAGAELSVTL